MQQAHCGGWQTGMKFHELQLDAGERGKLLFSIVAPDFPDNIRRLITAEIKIDGQTQGAVSEALVTVCV